MIGTLIQPEIQELINSKNWSTLKEIFLDFHPTEIADILETIEENNRPILFRLLPKELAADTFEYLNFNAQNDLLKGLANEEVAEILNEMSPDDRTEMLEELPGNIVKDLVKLLSPEERKIAVSLLGYPEYSIGRIMTPDFIALKTDWRIDEAIEHIRKEGEEVENIEIMYITDNNGILLDEVTIKEVLLAKPDQYVRDIMNETYITLRAEDDQEKALEIFKEYDYYMIPVVDKDNYLIGIVTADDVLDVAEEESTEDIQKFGGMEALEMPYIATPFFQMVRKRAGWLIILFIGEMLTASAMGFFENEIARAVVLALFVPLIISSGGNSGSQAATLTIRAMALKEINLRDWWRVMRREVFAGLALGTVLGAIGFLRISAWTLFSDIYGPHWILLALTVTFSLIGVVMWGTFSGSMLPFLLRKLGIDPATSSAPFVATLVDVTGLIIYFSIAALILRGTLL